MEYTSWFLAQAQDIPPVEKWPMVNGGAMKLWFKEQEEEEKKGHPKY
jgi:hypothetical protein